jgi:hypothetical protein
MELLALLLLGGLVIAAVAVDTEPSGTGTGGGESL